MKTLITFGQAHSHILMGKLIDKDCIVMIDADTAQEGRNLAMDLFKGVFCTSYTDSEFKIEMLDMFPRGIIEIDAKSLIKLINDYVSIELNVTDISNVKNALAKCFMANNAIVIMNRFGLIISVENITAGNELVSAVTDTNELEHNLQLIWNGNEII